MSSVNLETLRVSATTNPTKLAGAIANTIQKGSQCELVAIGPGPVNQAVKGMIIAEKMVAASGKTLRFRPGFVDIDVSKEDGEKDVVTGITFQVISYVG